MPFPYYIIRRPSLASSTGCSLAYHNQPLSGFGQPQFFNHKRTSGRTMVMSCRDKRGPSQTIAVNECPFPASSFWGNGAGLQSLGTFSETSFLALLSTLKKNGGTDTVGSASLLTLKAELWLKKKIWKQIWCEIFALSFEAVNLVKFPGPIRSRYAHL